MKTHVVSKKNQIRSILFVLLLMVITITVILNEYSMTEIIIAMEGAHPIFLIAGIGAMFLNIGCQALIFFIILRRLAHPASIGYCVQYAYVGNYFGGITPGASGAQPAQMYYMNKDKIHVDISAITVFFMVFISQLTILGFGGLFYLLCSDMVAELKSWLKLLMVAGCSVLIGLTVVLLALMFMRKTVPFLFRIVLKAGAKLQLVRDPKVASANFEALTVSYREKSRFILKHPDLFLKVLLLAIVQWASYYGVSYLVYRSFGNNEYSAIDLMAGQSFVSIAVSAVPIPGSVGVAENAYLNIFGRFYTLQELPSAMILSRLINFYLPLFISFFVYLIVHFRVVKMKKLQQKT